MKVLVVDDDPAIGMLLDKFIKLRGWKPTIVSTGKAAIKAAKDEEADIGIIDWKLPDTDGITLMEKLHELFPNMEIIIITGKRNVPIAADAIARGAYDFLPKPLNLAMLEKRIVRWEKGRSWHTSGKTLTIAPPGNFEGVLGRNPKILYAFNLLMKVADTDVPVLITGETGTGKELFARALHKNSSRVNQPMVHVNCAAIPDTLLESELFGYEKGAFTGASSRRKGKFEQAQKGTIFLDEIGDMNLSTQAKILRIVQEKEMTPLGSERTVKLDVRVVAATNHNLPQLIEDGRFRKDLFYRLNTISIQLPSLRERLEDIPILTEYFVDKFNKKYNKNIKGLMAGAERVLMTHRWPGNIRELKNIVERAVLLAPGEYITAEDLFIIATENNKKNIATPDPTKLGSTLKKVEKETLEKVMNECNWNQSEASRRLGIKRTTLRYRLQKYGLLKDEK